MKTTIIEIEDVTKDYGEGEAMVRALDSVSVNIHQGEFIAVTGPSGSGKSTFMNILGCLDRPTKGTYRLKGEDVSDLDKVQLAHIRNKRIGFVFQSYNLLARTSAYENVRLPIFYNRAEEISAEEKHEKVTAILKRVGLGDRMGHLPHELSGGQAQRVAIARALINDPVMILADEPTGNLDSKSGKEIMNLLTELHAQGRTIIMVTHDENVAAYATRRVHFLDGQIESDQRQKGRVSPKIKAKKVAHVTQ